MADVRVIEAHDQDGSQLWQHDGCWGTQPASNLGGQDAPPPKKCPLCGEPGGSWYPLYRPSGPREIELIDRTADRIEAAARQARELLTRALS